LLARGRDCLEEARLERAMKVTYLGYVLSAMATLKRMKPRDLDVIIQVVRSAAR
jgi:hypothetical protein